MRYIFTNKIKKTYKLGHLFRIPYFVQKDMCWLSDNAAFDVQLICGTISQQK